MKEFSENQLIEDMFQLSVGIVVRKLIEMVGEDKLIYELIDKENIKRLAGMEFDMFEGIFEKYSASDINKNFVLDYLKKLGLKMNPHYSESLICQSQIGVIEVYNDEGSEIISNVFICKDSSGTEIEKDLYIVNDVSDSVEDVINSLGMRVECIYDEEDDECIAIEVEGDINIYNGKIDYLIDIRKSTQNNKVKALINYYIQSLVRLGYPNTVPIIIIEDIGGCNHVVHCNVSEEYGMSEIFVQEVVSVVELIIIANVLAKELKKEGYLL